MAAVSDRKCVRICYNSLAERKVILTRVEPYRLLFSQRSWYVIGRSSIHRADADVQSRPHSFPGDARRRLSHSPRLFAGPLFPQRLAADPGARPGQEVVVRFGRLVADNVAEVAWHKTQRVVRNDDGTLDFHATVSGLNEISWWILGYGEQAEVLRPAKLRELVATHAIRMAQRYSQDATTVPAPLLHRRRDSVSKLGRHAHACVGM